MEQYIIPGSAYRKLKAANSLGQTAYIYGAAGYGKTAFIQKYMEKCRPAYLDCGNRRWDESDVPAQGIVVLDNLHLLEESRREMVRRIIAAPDVWLILISRSPVPAWLMPEYINVGFMIISENDLRLGRKEIAGYLDRLGLSCTEDGLRLLTENSEGNAYAVRHAALKMAEGMAPGPQMRKEIHDAFARYLTDYVMVEWDSELLEFLMRVTIDDSKEGTPEIGTTATADGEKISEPLSEVTIIDTVRYSGLTVGKTYKLSGVLMDKATGEPLTVDGKQITAEKEFTPKAESGTVELSFTFNASALAGKSVVVFEDLFEGESKVASHADIEDEDQTVEFTEPKIGTTATANGEHTVEPVDEITIVDTVKYSGLIPGKEYTVKGVLMDKATGKPLMVNDKEITAEATFRASKAEGSIDIPFTFAASALAGKTVVVFETLYRDKLEVCTHADIEDKDQTVTFSEKPEIKTTATVNGEKKVEPKREITITDTVSYTGLTPGKTYKLSGVLMDKSTGGKLLVDGKEITVEKEFTPESGSGTEEIQFTLDASALAGKSVVVFETLYHEDKEIAVHADIDDEGQTVEFTTPDKPEIKTEATVNGEKEVDPLEEVTIIDTVSYSGLLPGKPYRISGILMDKSTGQKLLVDGKEVTAEVEFTPENAAGSVEIPFTFNASTLAGKSIVVFETLFQEDVEVFVHADINDKRRVSSSLGRLGDKLLVEVQFIPSLSADHYNALQVILLNRGKGFVDKENFLFRDLIGPQRREDLGEVEPGSCRDHKRILAGNQPDDYMCLYSRLPTARCGNTAASPPGLSPSPRPSARRLQTASWDISGCSRARMADP